MAFAGGAREREVNDKRVREVEESVSGLAARFAKFSIEERQDSLARENRFSDIERRQDETLDFAEKLKAHIAKIEKLFQDEVTTGHAGQLESLTSRASEVEAQRQRDAESVQQRHNGLQRAIDELAHTTRTQALDMHKETKASHSTLVEHVRMIEKRLDELSRKQTEDDIKLRNDFASSLEETHLQTEVMFEELRRDIEMGFPANLEDPVRLDDDRVFSALTRHLRYAMQQMEDRLTSYRASTYNDLHIAKLELVASQDALCKESGRISEVDNELHLLKAAIHEEFGAAAQTRMRDRLWEDTMADALGEQRMWAELQWGEVHDSLEAAVAGVDGRVQAEVRQLSSEIYEQAPGGFPGPREIRQGLQTVLDLGPSMAPNLPYGMPPPDRLEKRFRPDSKSRLEAWVEDGQISRAFVEDGQISSRPLDYQQIHSQVSPGMRQTGVPVIPSRSTTSSPNKGLNSNVVINSVSPPSPVKPHWMNLM